MTTIGGGWLMQRCEHLHENGSNGEVIEIAGIAAELCRACASEWHKRLDEEFREPTPIEIYAEERSVPCLPNAR